MQGCLLVDEKGTPLRTSIIRAEQRATEKEKQREQTIGFDQR